MFAIVIWALAFLPFLSAIPTTPLSPPSLEKRCTNVLVNPSFEAGIDPWLNLGLGSWKTRGVFSSAQGGQNSKSFFAESNATNAASNMAVSQSGLNIPSGTTVDCSAWVASLRPGNIGSTAIELFIDDKSCGGPVYLGNSRWVKVGGKVTLSGESHNFVVTVTVDITGPQGSMTWIDDTFVGTGC